MSLNTANFMRHLRGEDTRATGLRSVEQVARQIQVEHNAVAGRPGGNPFCVGMSLGTDWERNYQTRRRFMETNAFQRGAMTKRPGDGLDL